jgi:hypothetical protein
VEKIWKEQKNLLFVICIRRSSVDIFLLPFDWAYKSRTGRHLHSRARRAPCFSPNRAPFFFPSAREKFGIMKHDGCGFDKIEAQARVSPLWKSWA